MRDLDLVLLGATGFTGRLVAEHLASHAPPGLRWALAGRDRGRLEAVRGRLGVDVPVLVADVHDEAGMRALAERARALATTVGPYALHGEQVVAACAAAGTDYLDLAGEPEFVDRTFVRHHATAERTGARLVHACGFESVPPDLGVLFTVQQLPDGVPLRVDGVVRARFAASGGTLSTALHGMARAADLVRARRERRATEPALSGRRVRAALRRPGRDPGTGAWVLPAPTLDPSVVVRSARALPRYGPDFTYSHAVGVSNPLVGAGLVAGAGAALVLAQLPPARRLLLRALPAGSGPSAQRRARGWFTVRFTGAGGGRRVVTEVSGGDPGYTEASRMLAQSALCLLLDDLPATAGQVTTAVAMGDALRERLERVGVGFRVLEASGGGGIP